MVGNLTLPACGRDVFREEGREDLPSEIPGIMTHLDLPCPIEGSSCQRKCAQSIK